MSSRLQSLVDFVDEEKVVADIGADHGIVALKVYEEKKPKKVIATDVSKASLQKLKDKIKDTNIDIELRVCDGIKELDDLMPEQIIIAGMGGHLIAQIIEEGLAVAQQADKLILGAHNSLAYLRRFLIDNNFDIIKEKIVYEEKIYYDLIVARYHEAAVSTYLHDYEYAFGKCLIEKKDPLLLEKIEDLLAHDQQIKQQLVDIKSQSSQARLKELDKNMDMLLEVKACLLAK